ncbi:MAG TPA: hypothetical protein PLM33_09250 [Acidobacteriota bacterium]|mgnify:FL=1|nr:hypothetical protein [Acidobacteriota bacterium]HRV09662.1 hypothetical protein [Acidobacteriota bacterium]
MGVDNDRPLEDLLPLELRLLILQAELERLESDARWVEERKQQVESELAGCREALNRRQRRSLLRRIK